VVPSFDPQSVFFVPVLDRQFGIAIEAVIIGANLRSTQLALSRSSRWTLEGALGSSVSIAEANGCTSSGHCSSLTQSGVPQRLQ
jgi:hypothetical protein